MSYEINMLLWILIAAILFAYWYKNKCEKNSFGVGGLPMNDFVGGDTGYIRGDMNAGMMRMGSSGETGVGDMYGEEDDYGGYEAGLGLTW